MNSLSAFVFFRQQTIFAPITCDIMQQLQLVVNERFMNDFVLQVLFFFNQKDSHRKHIHKVFKKAANIHFLIFMFDHKIYPKAQCAERLNPFPSIDNLPILPSPLFIFFPNPYFWQHFLDNIAPMKYEINTKINL